MNRRSLLKTLAALPAVVAGALTFPKQTPRISDKQLIELWNRNHPNHSMFVNCTYIIQDGVYSGTRPPRIFYVDPVNGDDDAHDGFSPLKSFRKVFDHTA